MSASSMRPTRPAQPITPILTSATAASHRLPVRVNPPSSKNKHRPFLRRSFSIKLNPVVPAFAGTTDGWFVSRSLMALLRSVATVGSYTLVSRAFGFIRDILTAAILGAGPVADAFFVAQRLPNLFRSLFAEGAFGAAFVPLASAALAEGGKPAAREFAEEAYAVLFAALLGFVVLGEIFMPWL